MTYMQLCTCILCKKNISCNNNILNGIHYSEKTKFLGSLTRRTFRQPPAKNNNLPKLPFSNWFHFFCGRNTAMGAALPLAPSCLS